MNEKEVELICRLKKKDQRALEEIITLFHHYVSAIVCQILYGQTDHSDIQGVINDVFFRLWNSADHIDIRKGESLKSYISAIARNAALTEKKNLRNAAPLEEEHKPLPTVKSRLQRSRKKFRNILEEGGFIYET